MASNTDTLADQTSTESGAATREAHGPSRARRGLLGWAAALVACVAVAALAVAVLRDDGTEAPPSTDWPAHVRAEESERQAHLEGQARTYGQGSAGTPAPTEADTPDPDFVPGSRHMPSR